MCRNYEFLEAKRLIDTGTPHCSSAKNILMAPWSNIWLNFLNQKWGSVEKWAQKRRYSVGKQERLAAFLATLAAGTGLT